MVAHLKCDQLHVLQVILTLLDNKAQIVKKKKIDGKQLKQCPHLQVINPVCV